MEFIKSLGAAVVIQAFMDYQRAQRKLSRAVNKQQMIDAKSEMNDIVRFLHSDWCFGLCGIDGDTLEKRVGIAIIPQEI